MSPMNMVSLHAWMLIGRGRFLCQEVSRSTVINSQVVGSEKRRVSATQKEVVSRLVWINLCSCPYGGGASWTASLTKHYAERLRNLRYV